MADMDIQELIAAQRAEVENPETKTVPITFGGQQIKVTVTELRGEDWQDLSGEHPPRSGNEHDAGVGFNVKTLPGFFPRVQVDGELVDAETWAEMYSLMDGVARNVLGGLIWDLQVMSKMKRMATLGKASAARRSASPANRASRRAASKGGSRPKSPGTSTTKKAD